MKTKNKYIFVLFLILFSACDPGVDEKIVINNKTDITLTIVVEKKGFYIDTSLYYFLYEIDNSRRFIGDTILIVECEITPGSELVLWAHGPIGTLNIKNNDDGMYFLNEITDTIYLLDYQINKDITDKNNWELYVKPYKNAGGESEFSFNLYPEDFELQRH